MPFQCLQCGRCCHDPTEFSIFEWEKEYLIQKAHELNITVNIVPELGFIRGNNMIVTSFLFSWKSQCPFLTSKNDCQIEAKKPLACAIYPHPNKKLNRDDTWVCKREEDEDIQPIRKSWYINPRKYLSKKMASAALIYRIFDEHKRIDFSIQKESLTNRIANKSFIFPLVQVKSIFHELIQCELLSPMFLESMKSYSFDNEEQMNQMLEKIKKEIKFTEINKEAISTIFDRWEESKGEEYSIQEISTIMFTKSELEILHRI